MSADTFCPRCFFGPLPDGVPERIRELEAERNGLSRHLEQALETIERLVEERDRLRETIEGAPCATPDRIPFDGVCRWRECNCWKRAALNTEKGDETT